MAQQLVARLVHPLLVWSANNLFVCNTVFRGRHVASSFYFLRSCVLCRRRHLGSVFNSFLLGFLFLWLLDAARRSKTSVPGALTGYGAK